MIIRKATLQDHDAIWAIIQEVISAGDSYMFYPDSSRAKMLAYWCDPLAFTYVAEDNDTILGTYVIRENRPDLGSHVANGSYMVASAAQGRGIGRALGMHSIDEARRLGYKAMQYNYVVKTNEVAVRLWQSLGFEIIGEVPEAYHHLKLGYVSVYIMWRKL